MIWVMLSFNIRRIGITPEASPAPSVIKLDAEQAPCNDRL
jgi:hypothetical protein